MARRVSVLGAIALVIAAACADRVQPVGSNPVTNAPPAPPPSDQDAAPAPDDAGSSLDAYPSVDANLHACAGCTCAPETSYCFAGASPRAPADAGADAAPGVCATASGSPPQVGCNAIPAACTATPTCACIIDVLQPLYRCYLNCSTNGDGMLVYCPNG
jgi:hypothetical protein